VFIAMLIAWSIGSTAYWHETDRRAHLGDENLYQRIALDMQSALSRGCYRELIDTTDPHPPVIPLLGAVALTVAPVNGSVLLRLRQTTWLWWILAITGTYLLGLRVLRDAWAAALSSMGLCSVPLVVIHAPLFTLDFPLTAVVAWALLTLIVSDGFGRTGMSLCFGLLAGLALLIKWTGAFFLLPVSVLLLIRGFRRQGVVRNGWIAAAAAVVVAGPWYAINASDIIAYGGQMEGGGLHAIWAKDGGIAWYVERLGANAIGGVIIVAAAVGAVLGLIAGGAPRVLVVHVLVGCGVFSIIPYKEPHYLLPAIPAVVIIVALIPARLPRRLRTVALVLGYVVLLLQHMSALNLLPLGFTSRLPVYRYEARPIMTVLGGSRQIVRSDGGMRQALEELALYTGDTPVRVLVAPHSATVNAHVVATLVRDRNMRMEVFDCGLDLALFGEVSRRRPSAKALLNADYYIVTGEPSGQVPHAQARRPTLVAEIMNRWLQSPVGAFPESLRSIIGLRAPEGHMVRVLARPERWTPKAIEDLVRFLWDRWPSCGAWAGAQALLADGDSTRKSLEALERSLNERDWRSVARLLTSQDTVSGLPSRYVRDLQYLAEAFLGDAEASARQVDDETVHDWIAVEVLTRAGRSHDGRARVLARCLTTPEDLQASDFLRSSHNLKDAAQEVPSDALPMLLSSIVPLGWRAALDGGFAALATGRWRAGLALLRIAHLASPHAEAIIRTRLTAEIPVHPIRDEILASRDLLDSLSRAERRVPDTGR
jgi:hypothetical protein